jgi:hypothetical protein
MEIAALTGTFPDFQPVYTSFIMSGKFLRTLLFLLTLRLNLWFLKAFPDFLLLERFLN